MLYLCVFGRRVASLDDAVDSVEIAVENKLLEYREQRWI